jgi:hypothetical protein
MPEEVLELMTGLAELMAWARQETLPTVAVEEAQTSVAVAA